MATFRILIYDISEDKARDNMASYSEDENIVRQKYFWYRYDEIGFPRRVNHAIATHVEETSGDACVYSFGGYHAVWERPRPRGPPRLKAFRSTNIDIHKLDFSSRSWNLVKTKSSKDDPYLAPCAKSCYGHSVCNYNGKIYMFGGRNDDDGPIRQVSCFDIATSSWINIETSGDVPNARDGHGCTLIGPVMFIHGGYCEAKSNLTNTLYGLNLETLVWELYPCKGVHVKERDFHTATAVGEHRIIIFGGRSDQMGPIFSGYDVYDDKFYCYNLQDGKWAQMVTSGYNPGGRRSHTAVYFRESIIYFAGFNSCQEKHFGDVFILNVNTNHITEVRPWGEYPCARRRSACALVGTELIICGGTSPEVIKGRKDPVLVDRSDTFVLNLFPSLQEMCISFIIANEIDYSPLPPHLYSYLKELSALASKRNATELVKEFSKLTDN